MYKLTFDFTTNFVYSKTTKEGGLVYTTVDWSAGALDSDKNG